jgi:hypothetical protein
LSNQLFNSAHAILQSRSIWENKQRLYYSMRHDGLRRRQKPFPTAADMHYPEIDMAIRRLKPFWMGQVQAGDRLAQFVSMTEQLEPITDAAADYMNFVVTQRTSFLRKLRVAVDQMLLTGRGVIKVYVDPFDDYALVFEAVNPLFIIMPDSASDFDDADEFVHVRHLTVPQYKRDRRLNQDPAVLRRIIGSVNFENFSTLTQDKRTREGVTHTKNPNSIILFEHYTKTLGGWTCTTYSPQSADVELRKPFGVPYKVNGKVSQPFFSFTMEVKDEGWYSPRGLGELLAPVEQYLTKLWNEKADAMTFGNRPVFTAEGEIQNTANIRWQPGEFIPRNVKAVAMPAPPFSFDQELNFARQIGEEQSQSPDFGITQEGGGKARTATENQRISALQQAGTNDSGNFFREDLAKLYKHVWGLLCQFKDRDFAYYAAGKIGTLPPQALHDKYLIAPDGSPDGWNRMAKFQKSVARLQLWKGDPNCDQDALKKRTMADDDAQFALKAFIPTNQKGASEAEDEAIEIMVLKEGYPAAVMPGEDHATRIMVDVGWLAKQSMTGAAVDPIAKQRVTEHLAQHFNYLKQTQPEVAKQMAAQIQQLEQQIAARGQGPAGGGQQQPQQPMPGQPAPQNPS